MDTERRQCRHCSCRHLNEVPGMIADPGACDCHHIGGWFISESPHEYEPEDEPMSEIIHEEIIERIGSACRIRKVDGEFHAEFAPLYRDGSFDPDEFGVHGGSPGFIESIFRNEEAARAYVAGTKGESCPPLANAYVRAGFEAAATNEQNS